MALWRYGTMALWHYGTILLTSQRQYCYDTGTKTEKNPMDLRLNGTSTGKGTDKGTAHLRLAFLHNGLPSPDLILDFHPLGLWLRRQLQLRRQRLDVRRLGVRVSVLHNGMRHRDTL